MPAITCADSRHALRSASPGWQTTLGESDRDSGGHICQACAVGRLAEATESDAAPLASMLIREDGHAEFRRPMVYDGQVIAERVFVGAFAAALTAGERTTLRALLAEVRDHLKAG